METRYLKEFITLAEKCNYTDAAAALFISQSSLFKHMKSIEHELDIVLFSKNGNRIALSEEGSIFMRFAKNMIEQEDGFRRNLVDYRKQHNTIVRVAFDYPVVKLLIAFRVREPDYIIRQMNSDPHNETTVEMLKSGKCELAFLVNYDGSDGEFESIPVLEDTGVAIVYDRHPLASHSILSFDDIADEDIVILGDEDFSDYENFVPGDMIRPLFLDHHCVPNVVFNATRGSEIVEYVRQEMGISVLFGKSLSAMDLSNIRAVPLLGQKVQKISLCYPKNAILSKGAQTFIKFIEDIHSNGELDSILSGKM